MTTNDVPTQRLAQGMMGNFFLTWLLSILVVLQSSCAFVLYPSLCGNTLRGQKENDGGMYYDDFDFPIGNSGEASSADSLLDTGLQARLNQLVATEQESQEKVQENWKRGHWSVRGCSLDPGDAGFGQEKVQVSALLSQEGEDTILVGRTDGSLCWLQIGSEYLATFTNQLGAQENSDSTISVRTQLKRDEASSISIPMDAYMASPGDSSDRSPLNFEIMAQVQASSYPIVDMVVLGNGAGEGQRLFVLSKSLKDPIKQFEVREDGPVSLDGLSIPMSTYDDEPSPVVAIKGIQERFMLAVTRHGLVRLWKPDTVTPLAVSSLLIPLEDDDTVLCCDADDRFVYLGTALGFVFVYGIEQILQGSPEPLKSFSSFATGGVSSIYAAGEGIMGKGRPTPTVALMTGSTLGEIKQWELLPRGVESVEYWPKLSSQKIPGKAHILRKGQLQSMADASPDSAILSLRRVQDGVILSATKNQLTIWNSETGKVFCDMDGLNFEQGASCLVLSEQLLVTNGMKQFVCVHDFSIDPNLELRDMIVPMDDEDE